MNPEPLFKFSIDRGGTFTDVYAETPDGFRVVKLLSEDPDNYEDAPREGIRRVLAEFDIPLQDGRVDDRYIAWVRMGTTVATNALLERQGAPTVLVVTRGFADILQIGHQDRPDIFDLKISKPELLYQQVIEVDEAVQLLQSKEQIAAWQRQGYEIQRNASGECFVALASPNLTTLRQQLQSVQQQGTNSVAVVFKHAYGFAEHERQAGALARELGFDQVSLSSEVMPSVKLVSRGDTTLVDAYLTPHIQQYLRSFRQGFVQGLPDDKLLFMQSDGGLTRADCFNGSRAILSGPAGGVVGYGRSTWNPEQPQPVIGFDMGGTSTDVSRYAGELELTFENTTAGVRVQAPQLDIRTVAAGGGSRLFFENGMFRVGPESAGAHPGPVCYRKGGYLTVTDANLVLGRLQPDYFPKIFGPDENQPLDLAGARQAMQHLTDEVNAFYADQKREPMSLEQVALGFLQVANEVMVRPVREVSVMRGFDIRRHILSTFGGAGAQHACGIARILGISQIFIHRFSGILSACGIGMADTVLDKQQPFSATLNSTHRPAIEQALDQLQFETEQALSAQGIGTERIHSQRFLNLRYQGTDTCLMIEQPEHGDFAAVFQQHYQREFGFTLSERDIIVDDIRIRAVAQADELSQPVIERAETEAVARGQVDVWFEQGWEHAPLYHMDDLRAGHQIMGPAVIIQGTATIVLEPACRAVISSGGDLEIEVSRMQTQTVSTEVDPVQLSVFSNLFMSIAEQMGRMLQKTAVSTNIKERLDFSCALFDPQGHLVANAPHVPVHLGAMSEAVQQQIIRHRHDLKPGDVLISNHPAAGGSHLPDMTVITPVFSAQDERHIIFWVASRGHHADIGGITPGSMPANSRTLDEEGVAIATFHLVRQGQFQEQAVADLLQHPPQGQGTRRLSDNLSDLRAQVAANQKGIDLITAMVADYGLDVVQAYMQHIQHTAEQAVRQSLQALSLDKGLAEQDSISAVDYLDDGSPIQLTLTIDRHKGQAEFDFHGTGLELYGNLNAPKAVTQSAILYSLRCLVKREIPLNHGCLIPVTVNVPDGTLLNPSPQAAVVGGNVLTSQRVVDVVLKAFGVAAASQGCMNNLTFGNDSFGYYETIGGGAGAGPDWHGQSGVHTHMTNTRITDPEVLERRYPVRVHQFAIRTGSGGQGKYAGGDGLIREIEFLEPLQVTILSERRVFTPYGLNGGHNGLPGVNLLIKANGRCVNLGGKNSVQVAAGDRLRIETPGGGGFGVKQLTPKG